MRQAACCRRICNFKLFLQTAPEGPDAKRAERNLFPAFTWGSSFALFLGGKFGNSRRIATRGIRAIKILPFDGAAARNRNQFITPQDNDEALRPVRKLRDMFGSDIEIAVEFHPQWNVTSAIRIAHALEPYRPMWLEDMLLPGNYLRYHELPAATSLPLSLGNGWRVSWNLSNCWNRAPSSTSCSTSPGAEV
jgi:hypothetical protein